MGQSIARTNASALPVKADKCASAHLRKTDESLNYRERVGQAVERARTLRGWTLDQLSASAHRDARQVARWIAGDERPQFDVLFGVDDDRFRNALVIAFAELGTGVTVDTVIHVRMEKSA